MPERKQVLPIKSERLDSIDALRGIAALMVAGYHIWGHYGVYPWPSLGVVPTTPDCGIFSYLVSPFRWGYLGVSLFLVLSGFCIHLPFARKKQREGGYQFSARTFFLRRMWRLYPAYAVSVIATFILLAIVYPGNNPVAPSHNLGDLISHLTLTHGFFDNYFYSIVHVYWSLALEFQLYLLYPLFLYSFYKLGITRGTLLLTIVAIVWRFVSQDVFGYQLISIAWGGPYWMMGFVLARMPEWLFGAWLAEWFASGAHQHTRRISLAALSTLVLFAAILTTFDVRLWALTDIVFGLGFALVIAAAIVPRRSSATERVSVARPFSTRSYKRLVWIGTISYSLYLFHEQLSWISKPWIALIPGSGGPFLVRAVILIFSIPIIALIYRFVEAPFLRPPKVGQKLYALYTKLESLLGIKRDAVLVPTTE